MTKKDAKTAPVIVLVGPQLGENIGGAARVMANFGLSELRLVRPREDWPNPKAQAMAAGADTLLDAATLHESLAEAIGDCHYALAATARPRGMEKDVLTAQTSAEATFKRLANNQKVAIVFGAEKAGLHNDDVALCDAIMTYPVNRAFSSLNLAQAVGVFAFTWGTLVQEAIPHDFDEAMAAPADRDNLVRMFEHFEQELEAAGYFFPPEKTPVMIRNIRAPLLRAGFTEQEVQTFRGVIKALAKGRGRHLTKK